MMDVKGLPGPSGVPGRSGGWLWPGPGTVAAPGVGGRGVGLFFQTSELVLDALRVHPPVDAARNYQPPGKNRERLRQGDADLLVSEPADDSPVERSPRPGIVARRALGGFDAPPATWGVRRGAAKHTRELIRPSGYLGSPSALRVRVAASPPVGERLATGSAESRLGSPHPSSEHATRGDAIPLGKTRSVSRAGRECVPPPRISAFMPGSPQPHEP
jgi:hypothetical protein